MSASALRLYHADACGPGKLKRINRPAQSVMIRYAVMAGALFRVFAQRLAMARK